MEKAKRAKYFWSARSDDIRTHKLDIRKTSNCIMAMDEEGTKGIKVQ